MDRGCPQPQQPRIAKIPGMKLEPPLQRTRCGWGQPRSGPMVASGTACSPRLSFFEAACYEKFLESLVFRHDVVVGQFGEDKHKLICAKVVGLDFALLCSEERCATLLVGFHHQF